MLNNSLLKLEKDSRDLTDRQIKIRKEMKDLYNKPVL